MVPQKRMSALTALVLGVAGVVAVGMASGASLAAYTLHVAGRNADTLVGFVENTVQGLPELIESLPPALGDMLNDRRVPSYAAKLAVDVKLVSDHRGDRYRPVLTVTNGGAEVVTMLGVHVAALDKDGVPVGEWTELVSTPIALDGHDWRGPLMPGSTRYMMAGSWRGLNALSLSSMMPTVEISDVRVWQGDVEPRTTSSVNNTPDE